MADHMYSNFKSQTEINAVREENKKARQIILEDAKRKFENKEAKKERARRQGEGTWMLHSVSHRITKEEEKLKKSKKKSKKKLKKKRARKSSSPSMVSDSDNGEEREEWVEANPVQVSCSSVKGPQLQRESWMEAPLDLIPTTSRQEIRAAIDQSKQEARRAAEKALEPGQHCRELNPYWRDGGTGLPGQRTTNPAAVLPASSTGDGGLAWLQKAYTRCVQQAADEGRALADVAAERYGVKRRRDRSGSRERRRDRSGSRERRRDRSGSRERRRDRSGSRERRRDRSGSRERRRDRSGSRERRRDRSGSRERRRDRSGSRERRRDRSGSRERRRDRSGSRERRRDRSGSRERRRDRSGSRERRRDRSGSRERRRDRSGSRERRRDRSGSKEGLRDQKNLKFQRPHDEGERTGSSDVRALLSEKTNSGRRKTGFVRPSDSDTYSPGQSPQTDERASKGSPGAPERLAPRWKKAGQTSRPEAKRDGSDSRDRGNAALERRCVLSGFSDRSRLHDLPGSNSDSDAGHSDSEVKSSDLVKGQAQILSEEELNELAAKILRAEIMGEDEVAADLKAKLEDARQRQSNSASSGDNSRAASFSYRRRVGGQDQGALTSDAGEADVVVLSRTSKGGMVRPVLGVSAETWGGSSGKKRRKTANTHDLAGERTIYFEDDNKFDLKTLVEREKAGTAEDQNAMFSRLAGRSCERDLDLDDMFVSKAARRQDDDQAANRDRAAAILEHQKINSAMEKCSRCFEKVPKHLIIAIGSKSYLCLPPHRSLTEGHCLIVPMQHISSGTAMDEDVWTDVQRFRKGLVQMFQAQDKDLVVMETVLHFKHFPHTAIECIPLERETGELGPIYFKKAILDAGPEWADNKKLLSLREKDVRHVIPKGFPYFSVDFGLQGGFATVVEDEQTFPPYFGREIVGGMIDAEPALWRKPHKQSFEDQRQKVLKFEKMWRPFDWTQDLTTGD
ncbi:hypothetical protein EGW08_018657 [Elysia chlorotica]|uniref:CWF19-like protein 2 n=1 Tax=Elysia chlorotica TaxID=188477 RepID=A0A3S0ZRG5_ELYCH|nr:hypothetical protein EGW08_018657 [Elysia chlorotica]